MPRWLFVFVSRHSECEAVIYTDVGGLVVCDLFERMFILKMISFSMRLP